MKESNVQSCHPHISSGLPVRPWEMPSCSWVRSAMSPLRPRSTLCEGAAFTFRRNFQLLGSKLSYSILLVILDQSSFVPRSLHFKGEVSVSLNQHERTCRKISTLPFTSLLFTSFHSFFFSSQQQRISNIPSHPSIQSFLLFTVLPLHLYERTSPRTHHHLLDWTPPWPR